MGFGRIGSGELDITMKKTCPTCKKQFPKPYTESMKAWINRHVYCCKSCYTKSMKGKDILGDKKNKIAWNKGRKCPQLSGDNNNFWKGGVSKINRTERENVMGSIEYKLWHDSVFARDGYTCQKYGTRGGDLHAHHIQNFSSHPELRFAIDNGVTFSKKAHKEFHKKYGNKYNTKEQLIEFLSAQEA